MQHENEILKELQNNITSKEKGYNYLSIRSSYNQEKVYQQRYKGREILEIIQNAEDANSKTLSFKIDGKHLIIINDGDSFSLEGYQSLLYSHLSSKPKGVFIGQKGLGFRSLINWANEIHIISNDFEMIFSEEISQTLLNKLQNENINDKNLQKIKDIEFLSIPQIKSLNNSCSGVKLDIVCKSALDLKQQFSNLDAECLFFLKNLNTIKTPLGDIEKLDMSRLIVVDYSNKLPIEYYDEEELKQYNENKRRLNYNIKLIWNPDKTYEEYSIYSYFRTDIKIGTPFLIHASFDLSDDRNNIENTNRNRFLISEICELLEDLVDEITNQYFDWTAYNILSTKLQYHYYSMYKDIEDTMLSLKKYKNIFPCIDNQFHNLQEKIVLPNEITKYIVKLRERYGANNFKDLDPVVIPHENIELVDDTNEYYDIFEYLSIQIQKVGTLEDRCELIKLFYEYALNYCTTKPVLLLDSNNELLSKDDEVFYSEDENFDTSIIPAFCKYKTINFELNKKLMEAYNLTQEEINSCINNIYPQNITNLCLILFDGLLENISIEQEKEIYNTLFIIFGCYSDQIEIPENYTIPVPSADGSKYTENLIFGDEYIENNIELNILGEFISKSNLFHFVANKSYWTFLHCSDKELIEFLKFMKVADTINYDTCLAQSSLFLNSVCKEDIVKLALLDYNFMKFIENDNDIVSKIKSRKWFTDYVIDTKKINFLNNDLIDIMSIKEVSKDTDKINRILKFLGAKDTIDDISNERFNTIIKKLPKWDIDGEHAGTIYDKALQNNIQISGDVQYYSKDINGYEDKTKLFYYDNKCIPASKLKQFPTIDIGRRKGHDKVSKCFGVQSIENFTINIYGKPIIDVALTNSFQKDIYKFYPMFLAYRFCCSSNGLSNEEKKKQANALKTMDIKLCREVSYTLNTSYNIETLKDFDFINVGNSFYLKLPRACKTIEDIRKNKKILYDFVSEMLLMTFKLTENNSYIKDNAVQTYIFNDLAFSVSRFEDDNDRTILREAENLLNITNYREEFWKYIHHLKNIDIDYEIWEQNNQTKICFSQIDYSKCSADMLEIFKEDDVNLSPDEFFKYYHLKDKIDFSEYNFEQFRNIYNKEKNLIEKFVWFQCNKKKENKSKFLDRKEKIQWDKNVNQLFMSFNYYINNFEKELWDKLKEIDILKDKVELIKNKECNAEEIYAENEKLYTTSELDIIKQNKKSYSLLYFEETEPEIKEYLRKYNENKLDNQDISEFSIDNVDVNNYTKLQLNVSANKQNGEQKINNKTSFSSVERATNNIYQGKNVEEIAYKFLTEKDEYCKKYINIKNVADEGRGYDIECIEKATGTLMYIEVKSFSNNYFEMTENEFECWQKNKDIYMIFLINTKTQEEELLYGENLENKFNYNPSKYKWTII